MLNHSDELSQEMYHRIYRMIKRNIEPRLIAATLNLPLKTVSSIVLRMKEKKDSTTTDSAAVSSQYHSVSDFLDVYLYTKTRQALSYLIVYQI